MNFTFGLGLHRRPLASVFFSHKLGAELGLELVRVRRAAQHVVMRLAAEAELLPVVVPRPAAAAAAGRRVLLQLAQICGRAAMLSCRNQHNRNAELA